jgi:hypothetical protein
MSLSPEHPQNDVDWERIEQTHHVVYLVKRAAYEFEFRVPKTRVGFLGAARAFFHVRFKKETRQPQSFVLSLEELEDFYDGLSGLMEYLRYERERHRPELMRWP